LNGWQYVGQVLSELVAGHVLKQLQGHKTKRNSSKQGKM
jgi:hypothetical protein